MGNLELSQCTLGKNPTFSLASNFAILKKMKTFGVIFLPSWMFVKSSVIYHRETLRKKAL